MKKIIYALLLTGLVFLSCKKEEEEEQDPTSSLNPTQEQRGFAFSYTATDCQDCGDWANNLIHDYAQDAPNGAVFTVHDMNDPMHNMILFNSFNTDRLKGNGLPSFWVGDVNTHQGNAMSYILRQPSPCGIDYSYEVNNGEMKVHVKVKFFEAAQGEYYLSVLMLEDGIPGGTSAPQTYQQAGTNDPNFTHDFVLRESAVQGQAYGELILTNPSQNEEFTKSYTLNVDASWNDVYPVCIVWKYDNTGQKPFYKYVNSLKKKNQD